MSSCTGNLAAEPFLGSSPCTVPIVLSSIFGVFIVAVIAMMIFTTCMSVKRRSQWFRSVTVVALVVLAFSNFFIWITFCITLRALYYSLNFIPFVDNRYYPPAFAISFFLFMVLLAENAALGFGGLPKSNVRVMVWTFAVTSGFSFAAHVFFKIKENGSTLRKIRDILKGGLKAQLEYEKVDLNNPVEVELAIKDMAFDYLHTLEEHGRISTDTYHTTAAFFAKKLPIEYGLPKPIPDFTDRNLKWRVLKRIRVEMHEYFVERLKTYEARQKWNVFSFAFEFLCACVILGTSEAGVLRVSWIMFLVSSIPLFAVPIILETVSFFKKRREYISDTFVNARAWDSMRMLIFGIILGIGFMLAGGGLAYLALIIAGKEGYAAGFFDQFW